MHNTQTMKQKRDIIQFEVPRQRTRAHVVLFCEGTPFRPKRVELKTRYQRRSKHRNLSLGD